MAHTSFLSTSRGLDRTSAPMVLFEKAKRFGIWNPSEIDLTQDRRDWQRLNDAQRDMLLRVTSMFVAGEEAVTQDLLPLIQAVSAEGRIEEEIYLTSFLWEEAKHVDWFNRFLSEVCECNPDLSHYHGPSYRVIIYEALPEALEALRSDPSPQALARASVVYNMVVEGVLAETGYHGYFTIMDRVGIFPGARQGIAKLKQDESRHIAYGVYLLSRLPTEEPQVWETIEETMNSLLTPALGVVEDIFAAYEEVPFPIDKSDFLEYALAQFQKRLDRIQRARTQNREEVNRVTLEVIEAEDA